jgi:hypothetical protein
MRCAGEPGGRGGGSHHAVSSTCHSHVADFSTALICGSPASTITRRRRAIAKGAWGRRTHAGLADTASRAKVTSSRVRPQLLAAPSLDLRINRSNRINKTGRTSGRARRAAAKEHCCECQAETGSHSSVHQTL